MSKNILLHGATDFGSSNYGDYIYGEMVYEYLKDKDMNVQFYKPSPFFKKYIKEYSKNHTFKKEDTDLVVYIPGGYFGEGHKASFKENLLHFYRFMPLGIWATYKKVPMVVLGIGAGPNKCWFMNFAIKRICNHSKFITVRDKESYKALKKICPKANIIEGGDLIITKGLNQTNQSSQLKMVEQIKKNKKILLVHYNHSKEALLKFAESVNWFISKHKEYTVVVASDTISDYEDKYFKEFEDKCGIKCEHFVYDDPSEMTALLKSIDVVLTCKLHVGVIAASFGKSVVPIASHPEKTIRFYSQIGESKRFRSLFDTTSEEISLLLEKYHDKNIKINEEIITKSNITWDFFDTIIGDLNDK